MGLVSLYYCLSSGSKKKVCHLTFTAWSMKLAEWADGETLSDSRNSVLEPVFSVNYPRMCEAVIGDRGRARVELRGTLPRLEDQRAGATVGPAGRIYEVQ